MSAHAILVPVFALAVWTFCILGCIALARVRATRARRVRTNDFRYGESAEVPADVCLPNRNYMNLLELPVLFYVVCLLLDLNRIATPLMLALAWAYVALRMTHSLIHLRTRHDVMHRFLAFALSNGVLMLLWALAGIALFGADA